MSRTGQETIARLREFTEALERGEMICERFRCKKVYLDLRPKEYGPELVRLTRRKLGVSQALFAQFLGVRRGTVRKWECGDNIPDGAACRLMDEIRGDPRHWRKLLLKSIRVTS